MININNVPLIDLYSQLHIDISPLHSISYFDIDNRFLLDRSTDFSTNEYNNDRNFDTSENEENIFDIESTIGDYTIASNVSNTSGHSDNTGATSLDFFFLV